MGTKQTFRKLSHVCITAVGLIGLLLGAMALRTDGADAGAEAASTGLVSAATASGSFTGTQWTPPSPAYRVVIQADMTGQLNANREYPVGEKDGIYQLTYADLAGAGLPVASLDPQTFQMFWMDQEIAIAVEQSGNPGVFEPGERVLFYARSVDSLFYDNLLPETRYEGENVYWLTFGNVAAGSAKRMASKEGAVGGSEAPITTYMHRYHNEEDKGYSNKRPYFPGAPMPNRFQPGADRWTQMNVSGLEYLVFQIANYPASGPDAQLVMQFQGNSGKIYQFEPDTPHHVRLYAGQTCNGFAYDCPKYYDNSKAGYDYAAFTITTTLPFTALGNGFNILYPELVGGGSILLNWYEIIYPDSLVAEDDRLLFGGQSGTGPWRYTVSGFSSGNIRVFDVTDMYDVQSVQNGSLTASSVEFADGASDRKYVAVADNGLQSPLRIEPVIYPSSGYTPADLLDTTNGADWIAITHRDFFTEALRLTQYRSSKYRVKLIDVQQIYDQFNGGLLSPQPIREFLRYAYYNWDGDAPEMVLLFGDGSRDSRNFTNAQPNYIPAFMIVADPIEGETAVDNRYVTFVGNDILPDMAIGRFPVDTTAEAALMVSKTIDYESTPTFNGWNTNIVLIADDILDGGGNFYEFNDILADGYEDPNNPTPETKFLPEPYTSTKIYLGNTCTLSDCRQEIIDFVNGGALFTSYVGHAQEQNWAIEPLVDASIIQQMNNYDRLSIFLGMACFEGFFHKPDVIPLAESYLFHPGGAAVASYSPTGFGVASGHDWIEKGLFISVFQNDQNVLGKAVSDSKYYLANNAPPGKYDDLIDTMLLFGDPALQIQGFVDPTAVDMAGMTAQNTDGQVTVAWETGSELEMVGFNVLRSETEDGTFIRVNNEMIPAKFGGRADGASYQYPDSAAQPDASYWYKLEVLKIDGTTEEYGLAQVVPRSHLLYLPALVSD